MQQVRQFGYPTESRSSNNEGLDKQLRQARKAGRFDEAQEAELEELRAASQRVAAAKAAAVQRRRWRDRQICRDPPPEWL